MLFLEHLYHLELFFVHSYIECTLILYIFSFHVYIIQHKRQKFLLENKNILCIMAIMKIKNKKQNKHKNCKKVGRPKHRGRGRPLGSKNKSPKHLKKLKSPKRFKKTYTKKSVTESYISVYKFMGYCSCGTMISKKDLVAQSIYKCPSCGKREKVKKLKRELNTDAPKNRKEYLENIASVNNSGYLALNDHTIPMKDLRIAE